MKALEIEALTKTFTGKKFTKVEALKGVSFSVEPGEVFGFLGPNGAGKSTTIKCLMGLIRPTSGSARIAGHDISSVKARAGVGYLPENPAFYDFLSAEDYLLFVGRTFGLSASVLTRRCEESLRLLEIWDARKRPMRSYSKGMIQRVGLAQVLIHNPEICILDEPMSGLDPLGRALVKEIILDLKKKGKSVFFSTHITDDVEKVCDRVGVIVNGRLEVLDSVENVVRSGIEGYLVQTKLGNGHPEPLKIHEKRRERDLVEYLVPAAALNQFLTVLGNHGIEISLIETKRKDLEAFFLDIVEKGNNRKG